MPRETQITAGPGGCVLTNCHVWSPDGRWVVYDTRSDAAGDVFDGTRIEAVNADTREIRVLYESRNGANCGVATWHPTEPRVAFILGPEHPSAEWTYGPTRRRGAIVDASEPGVAANLDARNLMSPFTPGALRGGSHVHVWHPRGDWLSFTYEDHVLARFAEETAGNDVNRRNVGVAVPARVAVPPTHPRNQSGDFFSVLVTRTTGRPRPGTDDISRAFEEAWIGTRQRRALAFQGNVLTADGRTISEVFVADLPDDLTVPGDGPLEGTDTRMPAPPRGVRQRRLTFTADREFPGISGPRHWLRSSPDGSRVGFLMRDDVGVVQFCTVSASGGPPTPVTRNPFPVASAFTWHPGGRLVTLVADNCVCVVDAVTGETRRITARTDDATAPRPEACVFSPDGGRVAFVRRIGGSNQICVAEV
ncbi:MAG: DUF3748 domain-containing protein [Fimbriiglobus sp.]